MNKRYKFAYRSKALNTLYVCLQNLMLGLLTIPVTILIALLLKLFGVSNLSFVLPLMWALVGVVFLGFQLKYWLSHKGVTVTDTKLIIDYSCIVPPVHTFKTEILIKGIESIEICTEPVSQRIEEVEGGAYNKEYVLIKYGYGGRKEVRLPLLDNEDFINTVKELTKGLS